MRLIETAGVTLDVCVPCRGVWFDRGELGLIIYNHRNELQRRINAEGQDVALRERSDLTPLDFVPDLAGVSELAAGAGKVAVNFTSTTVDGGAGEVVWSAGKLAASAGVAVVEGASGAVDAVVDVVAGIFSGL
jgi:Zn-finger nucleic acid-binding protein